MAELSESRRDDSNDDNHKITIFSKQINFLNYKQTKKFKMKTQLLASF